VYLNLFGVLQVLISSLVPVCNWADDEPRGLALKAFIDLFEAETAGDAALISVRHMAHLLKGKHVAEK